MPDEQGNLTNDDWASAIWGEQAPAPVETAAPQAVVPDSPAPATTDPAPLPVTPAPVLPDYTAQQRALETQQAQLTIQQQSQQYEQQLIAQGHQPASARLAAQQAGQNAWSQFQLEQTTSTANASAKSALVNELAREKGIDPKTLEVYNDPTSMRAAADQIGQMTELQKQVAGITANPKAPVQQFAQGNPAVGASNSSKQLAYVLGTPGSSMNRQEFIDTWGWDPN